MLFQKPTYDWLIAGLGNPGSEYEKTRHNTGFMSLDLLAARLQVKVSKERFKALTAQADFDGQRLLLMKPLTFMNASGIAIEAAAHFYKIPPERVLVLFDDISLPVGKLRIRKNGSAGGHNGLKSIISCLGSDQFPRVKIGVGAKPHPDYDLADWVLSPSPKPNGPTIRKPCPTPPTLPSASSKTAVKRPRRSITGRCFECTQIRTHLAHIAPARRTVFYGNLQQIRNFPTGRCGHRPLQGAVQISPISLSIPHPLRIGDALLCALSVGRKIVFIFRRIP